jgi:sulfur-oxidizing protein SoxA
MRPHVARIHRARHIRVAALAAITIALAWSGLPALGEIPLEQRKSTYELMSPETKAMQDEDTANPASLWVLDGEAAWKRAAGDEKKACADCHEDAAASMKGVAAHYPVYDAARDAALNLETRINLCRTEHQRAAPLAAEGRELLALAAFLARQARGTPIAAAQGPLLQTIEHGRQLFTRRQGQINLSCAQCHDDNWDQKLAGVTVPQGHPTAYPVYRLEWQTLGSLQRRLRNCLIGMRAEPYIYGSPEYIALEAYLMWRARGMPLEGPGVRP